jgi:hypothetical protein
MRRVGRAVVLGGGQLLREEDEQNHLSCGCRVLARPAARAEGDDEEGGRITPHSA